MDENKLIGWLERRIEEVKRKVEYHDSNELKILFNSKANTLEDVLKAVRERRFD